MGLGLAARATFRTSRTVEGVEHEGGSPGHRDTLAAGY